MFDNQEPTIKLQMHEYEALKRAAAGAQSDPFILRQAVAVLRIRTKKHNFVFRALMRALEQTADRYEREDAGKTGRVIGER